MDGASEGWSAGPRSPCPQFSTISGGSTLPRHTTLDSTRDSTPNLYDCDGAIYQHEIRPLKTVAKNSILSSISTKTRPISMQVGSLESSRSYLHSDISFCCGL